MIIKYQAAQGPWQMFDDVDSLRYEKLPAHNKDLPPLKNALDFSGSISQEKEPEGGFTGRVLVEFMNSKQLEESQIVAFSPVYVMNNEGRTIETI